MGTIYKTGKFTIRVNGFEPPPIHAHVTHTDGRAMVYLNGSIKNTGISESVMTEAKNWIAANHQAVVTEWNSCNPKT